MADWDTNSPEDSDIVSQYPANARAARAAVRTNFGVDHREQNDDDVGKHEVIQMVAQGSAPTIAEGQVGIWNEGGVLKTRLGTGGVTDLGIESGSRMLFHQAAAPTGWTQDTSVNDRVLRVVNDEGGGNGGSWTISGITVNGHSLTISQMPSHDHSSGSLSTGGAGAHSHTYTRYQDTDPVGGGTAANRWRGTSTQSTSSVSNHTHSISGSTGNRGGGSAHSHGLTSNGSWRPSYTDVIVAEKD